MQMGKWSLRVNGNTLTLPLQVGFHLRDLWQEGEAKTTDLG